MHINTCIHIYLDIKMDLAFALEIWQDLQKLIPLLIKSCYALDKICHAVRMKNELFELYSDYLLPSFGN